MLGKEARQKVAELNSDVKAHAELFSQLHAMPYDYELVGTENNCNKIYVMLEDSATGHYSFRHELENTYFDLLALGEAYWELLSVTPTGAHNRKREYPVIGVACLSVVLLEKNERGRLVYIGNKIAQELHPSRYLCLVDFLKPGESLSPEVMPSLVERALNSITQEYNVKFRLRKLDEKPPDPSAMYYLLQWKPEK